MAAVNRKGTLPAMQQGFSLMEAMVCVLVLSVGLLGLARLQARLWSASEQLHTTATAYLVSRDYLEKLTTPFTGPLPVPDSAPLATVTPGTTFTSAYEMTQADALQEIAIATRWQDPRGTHVIHLRTTYPLTSPAADNRWLLAGNQDPESP